MKSDTETTKAARFEARISDAQKALFQRAASLAGHRNLSDFVIHCAQEKAEALIRESEVLRLSDNDRKIFIDALLHPPAPNQKLKQAGSRYKKLSTSL